jgi:tetratricopeptide (TPR) repeat protein
VRDSSTTEGDEPGDHPGGRQGLWWLLLALVATAVVFSRSLDGELVYDDKLLIAENPGITELANLPSLFARSYWEFLEEDAASRIGYWRPLTAVADSLAWAVGGGSPFAFHLLSVLVHLAATAVAFRLARRLTGSAWIGGFAALLFGLHPTHVESVAWISALNDPMFGLFTLLSLDAFLRWRRAGSDGYPLLACTWFAAGLLSKEMAAAVVPLLVVMDLGVKQAADQGAPPWWQLRRLARAYGPFIAVVGVYLVARMFVFQSLFAGFDRETTDFGVGVFRQGLLRIELIGQSLWLLGWPADLALFRAFRPHIALADPFVLRALFCITAYLAVLALLVRQRAKPALFALLAIPAGFLPVLIRVESLGTFPMSDRFLYIPVFGFVLLLCAFVRRVLPAAVGAPLLLLVAGLYGWKSWDRIAVWENEESLFRTSAVESPRSPYVLWGLGRVLLDRFQETDDPVFLDEAFLAYERAQELLVEAKQPRTDIMVSSRDYLQVNLGLGWCFVFDAERDEVGGYATPIAIFEELVRVVGELEDRSREVRSLGISVREEHLELHQIWTALGTAQGLAGNLAQAKDSLKKALSLYPDYPQAHQNLGRMYARDGEWTLAIHHFEKAVEKRAGNFEDQLLLAQTLATAGEKQRAEQLALEMVERFPDHPEPLIVLATLRLSDRAANEALTYVDRALQINPGYGHAWYQKARALLLLGVNETATIQAFRRATDLMPANFEANYDFAAYLLQTGAVDAARPYLITAYATAVDPRHVQVIYQQLNQLTYETPAPLFELATIEGRRGRLDLAESWLDRALAIDPDHGDTLFQKGRILRRQKRDEEAVALMRRATELMPDNFVASSELGAYLAELGRTDEALAVLERTLEMPTPVDWGPEMGEGAKEQLRKLIEKL